MPIILLWLFICNSTQKGNNISIHKYIGIPESFNTYISHQLFDNPHHYNTNLKDDFTLKNRFKRSFILNSNRKRVLNYD